MAVLEEKRPLCPQGIGRKQKGGRGEDPAHADISLFDRPQKRGGIKGQDLFQGQAVEPLGLLRREIVAQIAARDKERLLPRGLIGLVEVRHCLAELAAFVRGEIGQRDGQNSKLCQNPLEKGELDLDTVFFQVGQIIIFEKRDTRL